jgi:mRNA interferase RelE/StbE
VPYSVLILESAKRQLADLPKKIQGQIASRIDALVNDPRPSGVKLLHATARICRLRSGDYRILYQIDDEKSLVTVTDIGDRKDIYRGL